MVPRAGFEPATYRLGGDCSIQLSYRGHGIDRINPNAITNQCRFYALNAQSIVEWVSA